MDRQAASLLMIAAGAALAIYYYNLDRGQRDSLLSGLGGKPRATPQAEGRGGATGARGPFVGPPRATPPIVAPPGLDWMVGMKQRFNEILGDVRDQFRRAGVKPPYDIKPFPQ